MAVPRLELWFANQDGLVDLLGIPASQQSAYLPANLDSQRDRAMKQHALVEILEQRLQEDAPPELQELVLASTPQQGQLISIEQAFYFKLNRGSGMVRIHAALDTDSSWTLEGLVDSDRFPFYSTFEHLSGRTSVLIIASLSAMEGRHLRIRPLFVGHRSWSDVPREAFGVSSRRIHPMDVDHFSQVDWKRPLTATEIKLMAEMPETSVKEALAKIIGVPFVPKDWGGERSDLVTNSLIIRGKQMSAVWLLKGRSIRGSMTLAALGKNGDQIERLTTDPSELIVVQHNGYITAPVIHMAEAFAHNMRNPRYYMILDGQATAMVLRDHGHLT